MFYQKTLCKKIFVKIEVVKPDWEHFENGQKRDFYESCHFQMAVSQRDLVQMQFTKAHFEGLFKRYKMVRD